MGIEQIAIKLTNAGLKPSVVKQGENFLVRFSGKNGKQFAKLYNKEGTLLGSKIMGNGFQIERHYLQNVTIDGQPFANKVIQTKKVSSKDGLFEQMIGVRHTPNGGKDIGIGTRINGGNPTSQNYSFAPRTQVQPYQTTCFGTTSHLGRTTFTTGEGVKIEMPPNAKRRKEFVDVEDAIFADIGRTTPPSPRTYTPNFTFRGQNQQQTVNIPIQSQVAAIAPMQPNLSSGIIGLMGLGAAATLLSGDVPANSGPPVDNTQSITTDQILSPDLYQQYLIQQQQQLQQSQYQAPQGYRAYNPQYQQYSQYTTGSTYPPYQQSQYYQQLA